MKNLSTQALVLSRTNYGESDRILTIMTVDGNKITLIAKGVRKLKSKLAGGIELFCESDIVYVGGNGKMGRLISARVRSQYGNIVKDIEKTMFGYELIKIISRFTEGEQLTDYYSLILLCYEGLNDASLDINIVKVWAYCHLLNLSGHQPNIQTDHRGGQLELDKEYEFNIPDMTLVDVSSGPVTARHIKYLRLVMRASKPRVLDRIVDASAISSDLAVIASQMVKFNL